MTVAMEPSVVVLLSLLTFFYVIRLFNIVSSIKIRAPRFN